jgi:hypothetical protein
MRRTAWAQKCLIAAAAFAAFSSVGFGGAEQAEAQPRRVSVGVSYGPSYAYYGPRYGVRHGGHHRNSGPIYHAPSVHYDPVYHAEYYHWTPGRGVHTHGHYDYVPHYVPGHFDRRHHDHIDLNPHFHD